MPNTGNDTTNHRAVKFLKTLLRILVGRIEQGSR
jgi:hypothetical protein